MSLNLERIAQFEELVQKVMEEHKAPGMAIAIAKGDDVVYSKGFGYQDKANQLPVTEETVFGIASLTKSVTGVALSQLVDQEKLSFDDPVVKYIPDFNLPNGEGASVTIHHMLTHTAGIPPLPTLGYSIRANTAPDAVAEQGEEDEEKQQPKPTPPINTMSELVNYLATADYQLYGKPGQYFSYSNDCYGLLGEIIEKVSGLTYEEYVKKHIFEPLCMKRSAFDMDEIKQWENVTELSYKDEKEEVQYSTNWQIAPPFVACGWMKSTAKDLIRYFQMYSNMGTFKGTRIMSEEVAHENISPARSYRVSLNSNYAHGLKFQHNYANGVTLVDHGGSLKGVSSNGGFVLEENISAVVLCNLTGVSVAKVWLAAINLALGLPIDQTRNTYEPKEWPVADLHRYLGHFKSGEGADFEILQEGDGLMIKFKKDSYPLKSLDEYTGLANVKGQEMEIRFYFDEEGKAWGVGTGVRIVPKA